MTDVEHRQRRSISLEPNWEGMRKWVLHVHRTDPELARRIAMDMGREAPELPDETEIEETESDPVEPGRIEYPDFE